MRRQPEELVRRAGTMEPDLEGELERLHPASFAWALGCCRRNREDAEEVLQTSYLKILEGRARFGGTASFKTFLFAVIRRTAGELRRRNFLRAYRLQGLRALEPPSAGAANPEAEAQVAERVSALRAALARLPRRQREVLELVLSHEMSLEEAARTLGISIGSARTHYERAKKRLARMLEPRA
jgi:RNA polymerase sigma-70 factor (ECF subfamily)